MNYRIVKITELVGSSDKGWQEAAKVALDEATKTIRGITGLEVISKTATVDPDTGNIKRYNATIKLTFGVER
ncbi:MAG TPA: dodecin family protein [Nitrososphaeraceae archaeon]|jgi:hypothetical protein|nr:dodecin family protein [Nitrososphaeraceae archaeon]